MKLQSFENTTGEGVVAFQPAQTFGPEYEQDHSRWYHHLTVAGERIFKYGSPCGTCGIIFRKVGQVTQRVSDAEAVRMLGELDTMPAEAVLQRLARILKAGTYHPVILEGKVRLVEPGTSEDYFATNVVRLFGLEPPEYEKPSDPGTAYYRFGTDFEWNRSGPSDGPLKALVTAIIMPLHNPNKLDRERVEYWKKQYKAGVRLTAYAVSVIDHQAPAVDMYSADKDYIYNAQFLFTNCLLDGHHRILAAAELGALVRILTLVAKDFCLFTNEEDLNAVVGGYTKNEIDMDYT